VIPSTVMTASVSGCPSGTLSGGIVKRKETLFPSKDAV